LGAFRALAEDEVACELSLVLCLAENAIGPNAYKPDDILTMPPSCHPPTRASSAPPSDDRYLRPSPTGNSKRNDAVTRWRTSKTDGPFSHSQQSPCCGFNCSPGLRSPLPLSVEFE